MIKNKTDLKRYLDTDKRILGISPKQKYPHLYGQEIWKFLIILRKHEFYANCHKSYLDRVKLAFYSKLHHYLGVYLGFEIPINVFEEGLKINHIGPIIVNEQAKVGKFCDIHVGVNIGQNINPDDVPIIGDNVWIGPGAKIFGKIIIADGVAIGANSVVNHDITKKNVSVAGVPAIIINTERGNPYKRLS